jgi:hypothetical protein
MASKLGLLFAGSMDPAQASKIWLPTPLIDGLVLQPGVKNRFLVKIGVPVAVACPGLQVALQFQVALLFIKRRSLRFREDTQNWTQEIICPTLRRAAKADDEQNQESDNYLIAACNLNDFIDGNGASLTVGKEHPAGVAISHQWSPIVPGSIVLQFRKALLPGRRFSHRSIVHSKW